MALAIRYEATRATWGEALSDAAAAPDWSTSIGRLWSHYSKTCLSWKLCYVPSLALVLAFTAYCVYVAIVNILPRFAGRPRKKR